VAEQQRHRRLGQEQHGDGGRDDEGQDMARQPPERRARKAVVFPVDHCSARSGVTTDMTVTATMP
jgi:hypothetical protein